MPIRSLKSAAFAAIVALPALLPCSAADAGEYARIGNVPIVAVRAEGAPPIAPALGLLTLPSTWVPGGAAAVLVADPAERQNAERDRLVSDLIGGGVAVLELLLPEQPEARLPILFGALLELSRETGAGHVVALGTGTAGQSVMDAAAPGTTALYVGGRGTGFTLLVALRPGCRFGTDVPSPVAVSGASRLASGEGGPSCLHQVALGRMDAATLPPCAERCAHDRLAMLRSISTEVLAENSPVRLSEVTSLDGFP